MRKIFIIIIFFLTCNTAFAQKEVDFDADPSFLDRVFIGGGLGFSTNNGATFLTISPIVGYMITQNLSAGVGVQYQFIRYKFLDVNEHTYGGSLFTRYNIQQFFLQGEYNMINLELTPGGDINNRRNFDRLLFGGGISQPLGGRARINILGMYDVLFDGSQSPFASPWVFRVYISG